MFGVIDEMRERLTEIQDRQKRTESMLQDVVNNISAIQVTIHDSQELTVKTMSTLKNAFNQIKVVVSHMSENMEELESHANDISGACVW